MSYYRYAYIVTTIDEGFTLKNILITSMVGSIILSLLGAFLLYKKDLKVGLGLSGFCFFGTLVWSLGVAIEKHGTNSVSIASMVFACAGAFCAIIPEPICFIVLGMGCGSTIFSFISWYFESGYITSAFCLLTSAGVGFALYKFPDFKLFAINWIGSYFAVSGVMMLLFLTLWYNLAFSNSSFYGGVCAISSITIIGILVTFGIISRHLFSKKPSASDTDKA